ncbi:hypothetical protein GCM10017710_24540 [Arthrobacter ramosus]
MSGTRPMALTGHIDTADFCSAALINDFLALFVTYADSICAANMIGIVAVVPPSTGIVCPVT